MERFLLLVLLKVLFLIWLIYPSPAKPTYAYSKLFMNFRDDEGVLQLSSDSIHSSMINSAHECIKFPLPFKVILKCNVNDSSFLISQIWNMLLLSICTFYAIKTRKVCLHSYKIFYIKMLMSILPQRNTIIGIYNSKVQ